MIYVPCEKVLYDKDIFFQFQVANINSNKASLKCTTDGQTREGTRLLSVPFLTECGSQIMLKKKICLQVGLLNIPYLIKENTVNLSALFPTLI